ncbi:MAG: bifunctional 2-C-methyl-D-erythritol 4-phosphate cytidylyltransferase/2-C-methyl-D-erythritol 2,4-cyclodiphosphate synthase [Hyphomonadaceae bacterium]|nr:bifunctional 2-C-methyl-D-erythritol 4-phosphate cytidylyltransferase/2-C-methyl-D-erythritol 2,4-cyclodiphosphate synthase [Hyphomonadaceae bacterium]
MRAAAVIVAAGKGERAGGSLPKQFAPIGAKPALRWSIEAFASHPAFGEIVVVCDPAHAEHVAAAAAGLPVRTTSGGAVRSASVRAGLEAVAAGAPQFVFIHDAARPGLSHAVIDALLAALEHHPGAAPALRIADALKKVGDGFALADVSREGLVRVQTPQAFHFNAIRAAFEALDSTAALDDDVAVARAAGHAVALVPGELRLSKITYPEDFALVEHLVAPAALIPLVGQGLDAHRFCEGSFVTLCGVQAPHTHGLEGHSDADAGWHALTDAILGAIGAGDIGDHFPPTDPKWRGADSEQFLRHALQLMTEAGGRLAHCDITIVCERPRIKPHREAMRARTAEVTGLPLQRVNIKATTTEEMGFTGRREGIMATATATVLVPG